MRDEERAKKGCQSPPRFPDRRKARVSGGVQIKQSRKAAQEMTGGRRAEDRRKVAKARVPTSLRA
jgi:hypothetical protein